jgi:hypothetical protein
MARIKLGKKPETITLPAKFEHVDGSKDQIKVTYIYRTRAEFAEFVDARSDAAREKREAEPVVADPDERVGLKEILEATDESTVEYIMEIAKGWDLADEFSRETVAQLLQEYPSAAASIISTYRNACMEGRTGN